MANRRGFIVTLMMLAPSTVLIAVFLIAPMVIVIGYSFAGRDAYGGIVPGFNLDSYRELFQPLYWPIFWNSVKLAFWNTVLCVAVAYPIAYFIAFRAGRWAPILLILMLIPFWIDFLIRISAWVVLMGRNGMINSVLTATILDEPARMLGTYGAVLVGLVYAFLPSAVFPIYAALQPIDRALLEAGRDLGAGPFQNFRRVTLPLSLPGVMAACLFVFVPSMGVFAIPVLLGGGKSIIVGNLIVQLFLDFRNMPLGSAVSVVLLVFSSLGILLYMRALRRVETAPRMTTLTQAQKTRIWIEANLLGRISPVVTLLAYLFLFVPIVVLIVYSFNASRSTVVWSGFTLDWYGEVFKDRGLRQALQVSAIIAFVSALASTAIGALTALAIVRRRFPGRDALSTLLLAPMVLPEIVMAVALLVFMVAMNVTLGYFTMIVSHVLISVPFATLIVRAAAASLDKRLEEAAADLGANEWQIFWRVTFPLLLPPIVTAFLLAATLSFDNFVMSTFTSGVGTTPLPLRIYSMLKLGITPEINALGTLMVLLNVIVVVAVMGRHLSLVLKK